MIDVGLRLFAGGWMIIAFMAAICSAGDAFGGILVAILSGLNCAFYLPFRTSSDDTDSYAHMY